MNLVKIWYITILVKMWPCPLQVCLTRTKKNVSQVCNRLVSSKTPADLSQVRHHSMPPGAGRGLPIKWPCQTACCAQRWQLSRPLCPAGKMSGKICTAVYCDGIQHRVHLLYLKDLKCPNLPLQSNTVNCVKFP